VMVVEEILTDDRDLETRADLPAHPNCRRRVAWNRRRGQLGHVPQEVIDRPSMQVERCARLDLVVRDPPLVMTFLRHVAAAGVFRRRGEHVRIVGGEAHRCDGTDIGRDFNTLTVSVEPVGEVHWQNETRRRTGLDERREEFGAQGMAVMPVPA